MRTDHEELCGSSYGSFCLNGGICYTIPTASNPFCRCVDNYTGARCEAVLLPSIKSHSRGELFVAVLASVVVLSVLVAGAIFFLCRKGQIPRATALERGEHLIEGNSSDACNIMHPKPPSQVLDRCRPQLPIQYTRPIKEHPVDLMERVSFQK